jgi:hypothetical protein
VVARFHFNNQTRGTVAENIMATKDRTDALTTSPRTPEVQRAEMDEKSVRREMGEAQDPHHLPPRPDPSTGEVRAGPGDAGLEDRPVVNAGSPGTEQMSNRRLGIGLGIAALLAVIVLIFTVMFRSLP